MVKLRLNGISCTRRGEVGTELRQMSPLAHLTHPNPQISVETKWGSCPRDPNGRDAFPFCREQRMLFGGRLNTRVVLQLQCVLTPTAGPSLEFPIQSVWDGPRRRRRRGGPWGRGPGGPLTADPKAELFASGVRDLERARPKPSSRRTKVKTDLRS